MSDLDLYDRKTEEKNYTEEQKTREKSKTPKVTHTYK